MMLGPFLEQFIALRRAERKNRRREKTTKSVTKLEKKSKK